MKYDMKYFNENAKKIDSNYCSVYNMDDHMIAVVPCDRCARKQYYSVMVDGITIVTRTLISNAIRFALNYLNSKEV